MDVFAFVGGLFAGIAFWPVVIILVESCIILAFVENKNPLVAFVSFIIALVLLEFLTAADPLTFTYNNPVTVLMYAAGYVVIAILYSFWRWDRLGAAWRRKYDDPDYARSKESLLRERPLAKYNKALIIGWMMFWPWSLFWWVLADFIIDFFGFLYRHLARVYDAISSRHTKGINFEAAEAAEPEQRSFRR